MSTIIKEHMFDMITERRKKMLAFKPSLSMETCLNELIKIFKENYCKEEQFKSELFSNLHDVTGNDNLGYLCSKIIEF